MEGMYWGDFRALINRNKKPWRHLKYYRSEDGFADTMSICDMTLPKRSTHTKTGHESADWYRDSFVCNAGYFNGFIPLRDALYSWDDEKKKWITKPTRGVKGVLKILLGSHVIDKTEEVARLVDTP